MNTLATEVQTRSHQLFVVYNVTFEPNDHKNGTPFTINLKVKGRHHVVCTGVCFLLCPYADEYVLFYVFIPHGVSILLQVAWRVINVRMVTVC